MTRAALARLAEACQALMTRQPSRDFPGLATQSETDALRGALALGDSAGVLAFVDRAEERLAALQDQLDAIRGAVRADELAAAPRWEPVAGSAAVGDDSPRWEPFARATKRVLVIQTVKLPPITGGADAWGTWFAPVAKKQLPGDAPESGPERADEGGVGTEADVVFG